MPAQIKVITKVPCPYCDRAINMLQAKGLAFEKVDLTDNPDEIIRLKNETGWKTVPMIFINGELIGGYNDLKALDESGKLAQMVK